MVNKEVHRGESFVLIQPPNSLTYFLRCTNNLCCTTATLSIQFPSLIDLFSLNRHGAGSTLARFSLLLSFGVRSSADNNRHVNQIPVHFAFGVNKWRHTACDLSRDKHCCSWLQSTMNAKEGDLVGSEQIDCGRKSQANNLNVNSLVGLVQSQEGAVSPSFIGNRFITRLEHSCRRRRIVGPQCHCFWLTITEVCTTRPAIHQSCTKSPAPLFPWPKVTNRRDHSNLTLVCGHLPNPGACRMISPTSTTHTPTELTLTAIVQIGRCFPGRHATTRN